MSPQRRSGNTAVTGWVLAMRTLKLEKEQAPKGVMTCLEVKRASQ